MKRRKGLSMVGALAFAVLLAATPPDAPVADAAMRGDVEAVRTLIKQGADVNAAQGDGMTALHWAAETGNIELAQVLVTAGANTSAVTRRGSHTPLHVAARAGRGAVVKALLDAGADANAKTSSGATALHQAAGAGSLRRCRRCSRRARRWTRARACGSRRHWSSRRPTTAPT